MSHFPLLLEFLLDLDDPEVSQLQISLLLGHFSYNIVKPDLASNGFSGCNDRPVNSICNSFLVNRFLLQLLESRRL
jgi:hypothetical protein